MGKIIGGIGASHAPSMAHAYDHNASTDPVWQPLFDGFNPAEQWLRAAAPDLMIVIYNDHLNHFSIETCPTFALGVADHYEGADEGWGKRDLPDLPGHPEFGWHVAGELIDREFDITICHDLQVDHGILSVLPFLAPPPWSVPVLPLSVNVIQHPLPKPSRIHRLGEALAGAVSSFPDDLRVVVIATGGLSHQLHGPRFGEVNEAWDNEFLDQLESDPSSLISLPQAEYMKRGGAESVEMMMWLAMRGALREQVKRAYRFYYAPMLTGYGVVIFEPSTS